jgi:hypothetical protein
MRIEKLAHGSNSHGNRTYCEECGLNSVLYLCDWYMFHIGDRYQAGDLHLHITYIVLSLFTAYLTTGFSS